MAIARASLISGPAKLFWNSLTFQSESDITVVEEVEKSTVRSAMFGRITDKLVDRRFRISFTPYGGFDQLASVFPSFVTTPAVGTRIITGSDRPLKIWGAQGDLWEFKNATITGIPTIQLGPDVPLFTGQCEFTAIIADSAELGDANAFMSNPTTGADPGATFSPSECVGGYWSGAWGAVTGWTAVRSVTPWQISTALATNLIKVEGLTRAIDVQDVVITASCVPIGPTSTQMVTLQTLAKGGALLDSGAYDLTLTPNDSSGMSIVLNKAFPVSTGYQFGANAPRPGTVSWVTAMDFTLGAPNALITFANT